MQKPNIDKSYAAKAWDGRGVDALLHCENEPKWYSDNTQGWPMDKPAALAALCPSSWEAKNEEFCMQILVQNF